MVAYHESEDVGFCSYCKMLTFREFNSKVHKILGIYQYKHGLFDFYGLGNYLVIDIQQGEQVLSESEAIALGFDSKEDYFSYNFNGFNCDDDSKMIQKVSFVNLDAIYGIFDELDAWIDSVEANQEQAFLKSLEDNHTTSMRMMDGSVYEFHPIAQ